MWAEDYDWDIYFKMSNSVLHLPNPIEIRKQPVVLYDKFIQPINDTLLFVLNN
jgi:hypothetical protein